MFTLVPAWTAGCLRSARLVAALAVAAFMTGCASHYVDNHTKEVPVAQYKKPASPKPVQVLYEFQTKGAPNGRATDYSKPIVQNMVTESGLFQSTSDAPVAGGGLLSITINNVVLTDDAARQGFFTGLTFGIKGSVVTDGYVCTVKYLRDGQPRTVEVVARHAIHTTLGSGSAPEGLTKAENIEAAYQQMLRQIVTTSLNDLSRSPDFN